MLYCCRSSFVPLTMARLLITCFCVSAVLVTCSVSAQITTPAASNVTDSGPRCKKLFTFGYGYRQFLHLSKNSYHPTQNGDLLFMRFQVRARSDAHILLSPSPSPEESDPVYEIVLGAGKNSFSDIRRRRRAATRASAATKDILSGTQLKGFWIRMTSEGLILVGAEGEELPVMQWRDPEPLDIQYFSFCTWSGVAGLWLYDCVTEQSTGTSSESEAVAPVLSATQRLRAALLTGYDVYTRPSANTSESLDVSVVLQANHIHLDAKNSLMVVGCELTLEWTDEKMTWDPEGFDGVELMNLNHHEIWRPGLIHFNGVGKALLLQGREGEGLRVTSDGRVRWRTSNLLQSRCQLNLRDWPWDTQTCQLQLGFWQSLRLGLILQVNGTRLQLQKTGSQWDVRQLTTESVVKRKPWLQDAQIYESDNSEDTDELPPSALTFTFTLRRTDGGVYFVFVIPLLVMILMSLSCFWMAPLSCEKLSMNCLLLVILCVFLLSLDSSLPGPVTHTPNLVKVYSMVLCMVACATVVTVTVSRLSTQLSPDKFPPHFLCRALSSQFVSSVFFLSAPKVRDSNLRRKEADCLSLVTEVQEEEQSSESEDRATEAAVYWKLLALLTDRVAFTSAVIAYTLVFVY